MFPQNVLPEPYGASVLIGPSKRLLRIFHPVTGAELAMLVPILPTYSEYVPSGWPNVSRS